MIEKLFELAFNKAKNDSPGSSIASIIAELVCRLEDITKLRFEERNVKRYYSALKKGNIQQTPSNDLVNGLSLYLGYKDYAEFIRDNSVGGKTISTFKCPWITSGSNLIDLVKKAIQNPFEYRLNTEKILKTLYPKLVKSECEKFYDFYTLTPNGRELDFGFKIIYNQSQNFDLLLWEVERLFQKFSEQTKKPWAFFVISNLLLAPDQLDRIDMMIKVVLSQYNELEHFYFLDFDDFISKSIRDLSSNLMDVFIAQNEDYKTRINQRMDKNVFLYNVPFHTEGEQVGYNPFNYITEDVLSKIDSREMFESHVLLNSNKKNTSRITSLSFLVAEFGYGKTSLLLQLASNLPEQFDLIFVPVAQLDEKCFHTGEAFICELYSIVFKRKFDPSDLNELIMFESFSSFLKNKQSVFLFFDGLDENSFAYSLIGLRKIFNCLKYIDVDCIISVREEFWKERKGDLDALFSNLNKPKATIHLDEWDESLINQFKKEYFKHVQFDENSIALDFNVQDNFENLYSEIPKRPLFLHMIMRDLLHGNVKKRSLKELYRSYLIEKFERDRDGVFQDMLISRPLDIEGEYDRYFIIELLWNILKDVAGSMILIQNSEIVLKSHISDKNLQTIIKKYDNMVSLREIILNTVLIPLSFRNFDGIKLHFAHKSFQEYYTALYLVEEDEILHSGIIVPSEILKFI